MSIRILRKWIDIYKRGVLRQKVGGRKRGMIIGEK